MAKSHRPDHADGTLASGAIIALDQVPKERMHFRALVVGNPNYFGNLASSPFPPVVAIKGNPTYEEIKCVGFHPQSNRLDAVVFVKQSFGYSGGVCSAGSSEYVRFYLSFDHGATWVDQGVTGFTAYDVPTGVTGGRRLEYAASVPSVPPRRWCTIPNIILARAILSWNHVPPANTPDYVPVWGNVHNTHIQVDPVWFLKWIDLFKLADLKLTPAIAESLDLDQTISAAPKKELSVAELQGLYKNKGVEPHRFAMAEIKKLIKTPEATADLKHPFYTLSAAQLGFSVSDVIGKLLATDGSTVYEELDCIGLKPNGLANELVGVLRIKRSSGFSGGPCTKGSREYVTFWGDFNNNGTFETCLGTASVQVFDLDVPEGGLEYSVNLPVNLNPYRRPCEEGPRVVPIRAILSWNEIPDCGNPNWVPTWGNRENTLILIPPGVPTVPGHFNPFIYDISNVAVCAIDQMTGLAAVDRPFGGVLCITGEIPAALDLAVADTLEYAVWATQGSTILPLVAPFTITVEEGTGPATAVSYQINQTATGEYFRYREHGTPALGSWRRVSSPNRLLTYWNTSGLTGTWTIHVKARVVGTSAPVYYEGETTCLADGSTRTHVKVTLDQEAPVADMSIVGYTDATGFHTALPCGDFTTGVTINGTFDITDNTGVGPYGFTLEPNPYEPAPPPPVNFVLNPGSTATHQFGTWSVATGGIPPAPAFAPCGYVVRLDAWDRTVVHCGTSWHDFDSVGFCLRSPGA